MTSHLFPDKVSKHIKLINTSIRVQQRKSRQVRALENNIQQLVDGRPHNKLGQAQQLPERISPFIRI